MRHSHCALTSWLRPGHKKGSFFDGHIVENWILPVSTFPNVERARVSISVWTTGERAIRTYVPRLSRALWAFWFESMDKCELIDIFWPNFNNTINTNRLSLPLRTLLLLPGADIVPHLTVQVKDCKKYKRLHYSLQSEVQQNRMNFLTIGSEPSAQVGVDSSAQGGRLKIF